MHQGLSESEIYGDLVYKLKKNEGRADFSDQFRKIIVRYKRIGYSINLMRQSACLVFNPITGNYFASLFNCTPVGRASDSTVGFLLPQFFSGVVRHPRDLQVSVATGFCQVLIFVSS